MTMDEIPIQKIKEKARETLRQETRKFLEIDREIDNAFYRGLFLGLIGGAVITYLLCSGDEKGSESIRDELKYRILDALL